MILLYPKKYRPGGDRTRFPPLMRLPLHHRSAVIDVIEYHCLNTGFRGFKTCKVGIYF